MAGEALPISGDLNIVTPSFWILIETLLLMASTEIPTVVPLLCNHDTV